MRAIVVALCLAALGCTFTSPIDTDEQGLGLAACDAHCRDAGAKGSRAITYEKGFGYERCTCSLDGGTQ